MRNAKTDSRDTLLAITVVDVQVKVNSCSDLVGWDVQVHTIPLNDDITLEHCTIPITVHNNTLTTLLQLYTVYSKTTCLQVVRHGRMYSTKALTEFLSKGNLNNPK